MQPIRHRHTNLYALFLLILLTRPAIAEELRRPSRAVGDSDILPLCRPMDVDAEMVRRGAASGRCA